MPSSSVCYMFEKTEEVRTITSFFITNLKYTKQIYTATGHPLLNNFINFKQNVSMYVPFVKLGRRASERILNTVGMDRPLFINDNKNCAQSANAQGTIGQIQNNTRKIPVPQSINVTDVSGLALHQK